jgi:hypothetical protein
MVLKYKHKNYNNIFVIILMILDIMHIKEDQNKWVQL